MGCNFELANSIVLVDTGERVLIVLDINTDYYWLYCYRLIGVLI